MKKTTFLFSTLLGLSLLTACANSNKANETALDQYENYESYESNEVVRGKQVYHASRTVYTNLINTKLEITPEWETAYLKGKATITAKPHFYASDSLILDAKGMEIKSVKMGQKLLAYVYEKDVLKITLDKTYTKDETYTVEIEYIAKPNERKTGGSSAISSDKGFYFINPNAEKDGFMPQIWTQGETEANSVWFPTIDSPNMKSAQEIYITVADKYKTLSNGNLLSSTKNGDGTRTDYWKQSLKHGVYLFMVAIGEFEVIEDSFTRKNGEKMAVHYFVEPEWKDQATKIFGKTPKMIRYFSDLLGVEYPWDKYHQIVVREYVSGAMENTGAVVFGDFAYKTDRELMDKNDEPIIAHELFHHWFGDLVTCESWSNLPLNESFANYSQYLWDEYEYGIDVAQFNMDEEVAGYFNSGKHHDLIWFDYKDKEDMFDGHSYNKGGAILHQLRNIIGDEAFFKSLNLYLTKHAYKTAEIHDLRMAFEEVTGQDLNWYFNNWFFGKGHPDVNISYKYNYEKTAFTLTFEQVQQADFPVYTLPIDILYVDDAGKHMKRVTIDDLSNTFTFSLKGALQALVIDPNKTLLGYYNLTATPEQWKGQFENASNYRAKKEAIEKYFELVSDKVKLNAFVKTAITDKFYGTQAAVLESIKSAAVKTNELIDLATLKNLAENGSHHEVRSLATELYAAANSDKNEVITWLDERSKTELSYNVLASILESYVVLNPAKSDDLINEFRKKHSSKEIDFQIANYYMQNRVPGKMNFFKDLYEKAGKSEKGNALMYLGYYSYMNGLPAMNDFIKILDKDFESLGYFKPHIAGMIVEATQQLEDQDKIIDAQIKKEKAELGSVSMMLKETIRNFRAFLDKYQIKLDE